MYIDCCACGKPVDAVLTTGAVIYPHREDLSSLPFWQCPYCDNYVGCHYKTKDRTKPLGIIPTQKLRKSRAEIHALIDPVWQKGILTRKDVYEKISELVGYPFHTAEIASTEEAERVIQLLNSTRRST